MFVSDRTSATVGRTSAKLNLPVNEHGYEPVDEHGYEHVNEHGYEPVNEHGYEHVNEHKPIASNLVWSIFRFKFPLAYNNLSC